jgi:8-oxo-dGTP pyrophosphatase MutT (NUDIX family)
VTLPDQPPKHSVSVAAAIIDDRGRFLAIRRADNGEWEPPGGILELDESIEDGLVREVQEETGLRVQPVALTGVYKNMKRGIIALVFRCEIVGDADPELGEVDELQWLTADELSRMHEAYRVRLLDALDTAPAHVRAHDGTNLLAPDPRSRPRH